MVAPVHGERNDTRTRSGTVGAVMSLTPLCAGGALYLVLRRRSLRLFCWAEAIGLGAVVDRARAPTGRWRDGLPEWVVYSLPDGLWLLSLSVAVAQIWGPRPQGSWWICAAVAVALLHEAAQWSGLVPGTFSGMDVLAYLTVAGVMWTARRTRDRTIGTI